MAKYKITPKKFNSMLLKKCNLVATKNEEIKPAFKEKTNEIMKTNREVGKS